MAHLYKRQLPHTVLPGSDLFSVDRLVYFDGVNVRGTVVSDLRLATPGGVWLDWMSIDAVLTGQNVTGWARAVMPSILASDLTTDPLVECHYGGTPDPAAPGPSATLSLSGLVGAWDGESTGPSDWSGSGNNGTGYGDTGAVAGKIGSALSLDGSGDYVDVGTSDTLNLTGEMSIGLWHRTNGNYTADQSLITRGDGSTSGSPWATTFGYSDGKYEFWQNAAGPNLASVASIGADVWRHVAFIRSGTSGNWTLKVFLDGSLDNTAAGVATNPGGLGSGKSTTIGRFGSFPAYYLNGFLDDMRIYNRVLSADEIAYHVAQVNSPGVWGDEISLAGGFNRLLKRHSLGRELYNGTLICS